METPVLVKSTFSLAVVSGAAKTIDYPLPGITDLPFALGSIEACFTVLSKTGAGVTPTLDCSIQSSPDNFATAGLTENLIDFTQATAATAGESKRVTSEDAVIKKFGANRRIHLVADSASGDVTFRCEVTVIMKCD